MFAVFSVGNPQRFLGVRSHGRRLSEIHKNHKEAEDEKPKEQKRKDVKHDNTNKSKDVHSRRDF